MWALGHGRSGMVVEWLLNEEERKITVILGGVKVNVLAIGPEVRGLKPGR